MKKISFKGNIKTIFFACLFGIFAFPLPLFFSCDGSVNFFMGDKGNIREEIQNSTSTEYIFYLDNPILNPDAESISQRYEIGRLMNGDDFFSAAAMSGYRATEWFCYDSETKETYELPINVHYTKTAEGIVIESVLVTQRPLEFFASGWVARTDTPYKILHYKQKLGIDDYTAKVQENYELYETEIFKGRTDDEIHVVGLEKFYEGFESAWRGGDIYIKGDGSSEICLYYNRRKVTITIYSEAGTFVDDPTATEQILIGYYETPIKLPEMKKPGHKLIGFENQVITNPPEPILKTLTTFPSEDKQYNVIWEEMISDGSIEIILPTYDEDTAGNKKVTAGSKVTLSATSGYSTYKWYIDGIVISDTTIDGLGSFTGTTSSTVEWTTTKSGSYRVVCIIDNKYSAVINVVVEGSVGG